MFFFTHPVRGGQHRSISLQYIICSFSTTHPTAVLLNPIFAWCHCTLFLLTQGVSNQHPWQSPLLLSWQSPPPPWPYTFSQERDKDVGSVGAVLCRLYATNFHSGNNYVLCCKYRLPLLPTWIQALLNLWNLFKFKETLKIPSTKNLFIIMQTFTNNCDLKVIM